MVMHIDCYEIDFIGIRLNGNEIDQCMAVEYILNNRE